MPYQANYSHYVGPVTNMVKSYFSPPIISIHLLPLDYVISFAQKHLYSDLYFLITDLNAMIQKNNASHIPEVDKEYPSTKSYRRNLEYLVTILRSDNVQLILGNQPSMYSSINKYYPNEISTFCFDGKTRASLSSWIKGIQSFNAVTKNVATENGIPFVDLDKALPRTPEYFTDYVHWSPKGNEIAAKKLFELIVSSDFIH